MPAAGASPAPEADDGTVPAVGANSLGWKIEAALDADGALVIRWHAPRPILEVKVGVGFYSAPSDDTRVDRGRSYTTKTRNRSNDPQPMGCITFPASVVKRFTGKEPAIAGCWDLDLQPVHPSVWTQPFHVVDNGVSENPSIAPIDDQAAQDGEGTAAADAIERGTERAREGDRAQELESFGARPGAVGKRMIGQEKLNRSGVRRLLQMIKEDNNPALKVLRLKQYLDADANPLTIDTVLDALENCTTCEALYIQNFEKGMLDEQVEHLGRVLQKGYIWALNIGENFGISTPGWEKFAKALKTTHVTHMYASEPNFGGISGKLKKQMRDIIRDNRKKDARHKSFDHIEVICQIGQMWWNPRNHIMETPVDQLLGHRPTRFCCDGCRSSVAKDRMLVCSGKGCRAVFHMNCLDPPLVGWPSADWLCPKCTGGRVVRTKKSNMLEVSAFSVIGLPVKIAKKDQESSPMEDGHIIQRDPGNREAKQPDHFLVEFNEKKRTAWCVLEELRCMVGGELVWARLPGLPWLPAQIFRHTALYPAEHYRRSRGQQYVQVFTDPVKWAWVPNHSDHLRPFDPRFDTMEEPNGLGTPMLDDEIEVLYSEDRKWYHAKVIEVGHKGCNIEYAECDEWKACIDFLPAEDIVPSRIRRPKAWQDGALQLESALARVETWKAERVAFAARPPSTAVRDPSVKSRRHKKPPAYVPPSSAPVRPVPKKAAKQGAKSKKAPPWQKDWADLTPEQRTAAAVLGYNEAAWTGNEVPPGCCGSLWERDQEAVRSWDELDANQKEAAAVIGYESDMWDNSMRGDDGPPPDNGSVPMFAENESIYAMDHEGMAYNSIVVSVRRCTRGENEGKHEYLVHFQGWNSRWDSWMLASTLFKHTKANAMLLDMVREVQKHERVEAAARKAQLTDPTASRRDSPARAIAPTKQPKTTATAAAQSEPVRREETLKEKKEREMREAWAQQAAWQKKTGESRKERALKRQRELEALELEALAAVQAEAADEDEQSGEEPSNDSTKKNDDKENDEEMAAAAEAEIMSESAVEEQSGANGNGTSRKRKQGDVNAADQDSAHPSELQCDASVGRARKRKAVTPSKWNLDSEPTNVLVNRPIAIVSGRQRQATEQRQLPQQQPRLQAQPQQPELQPQQPEPQPQHLRLQLQQPPQRHGQKKQLQRLPTGSQAVPRTSSAQLHQQPNDAKPQQLLRPVAVGGAGVPLSLDESVNAAMTMVSEEMTSPRADPVAAPTHGPPQMSLAESSGHVPAMASATGPQSCGISPNRPTSNAAATAAAAATAVAAAAAAAAAPIKAEGPARWGMQSTVSDDEAASVLAAAAAAMLDESLSPR